MLPESKVCALCRDDRLAKFFYTLHNKKTGRVHLSAYCRRCNTIYIRIYRRAYKKAQVDYEQSRH